MGGALLACLLPLVWEEIAATLPWAILAWVLTALMAWRTQASIPVGVLGVVTVAYWLPKALKHAWIPAAFLAGYISMEHWLLGRDLFDPNGRVPIYKLAMEYTQNHGLFLTGWGVGATQALMPILQQQTGTRLGNYFIWLHSDWLQTLTELGIPGLLFALLAAWVLFSKSRGAPRAALLGFMGMACFDYPLRLPLTAFCLLLTCCLIERSS